MLNERGAEALRHIIVDFVGTNVPVSSERVAQRMSLSSASIRNEMHRLTTLGYISQPHVSAGRVPTDEGYRFFVDNLIDEFRLAEEETEAVGRGIDALRYRIERLFGELTELLASWTQCIVFAGGAQFNRGAVSRIELTEVTPRNLLLLVVLSSGIVENRLIELPVDVRRMPIENISRMLNQRLAGRSLHEISPTFLDEIFAEIRLQEQAVRDLLKSMIADLMFTSDQRLYVDGARQALNQPEFQDARFLRPILDIVQAEHPAHELLDMPEGRDFDISIGHENAIEELRGCSLVRGRFRFGDNTVGALGVIGPRRMNYARLIALVRHLSGALTSALRHIPIS